MTTFNPPHPGSILKEDVLPELGIGVTEAAAQLGVSRKTLSSILNGKASISADMAIRLEAWMNGPTAEAWLRLQAKYDIWFKRKEFKPTIEKLEGRFIETDLGDKNTQNPNTCRAERNILSNIGLQLKKARELTEYSREDAANKLEISKSDLKQFESGLNIESIPLSLIKKASIFYDVSVDYIFGLNEDWENTVSARRRRDSMMHYDYMMTKTHVYLFKNQEKLKNRIESISKSFLELVKLCNLVDADCEEFFRSNPSLDASRIGKLKRSSKRAVEAGEKFKHVLIRYKVIEKNN
ncbi:HigA family addiction module antitoxin [Methylomonas sp. LWB]|uniref:HigA family addiction module antitoxin n=1 Tax=Methylomonas sp. LWB TaxID=1905845 RepID=UPI0009F61027|nr:HigA family addiction module antitoxin [Methylomonas sp. LWB]